MNAQIDANFLHDSLSQITTPLQPPPKEKKKSP